MINTSTTRFAFIDQSFAQRYFFPFTPTRPRRLEVIDSTPSSAGNVTYVVKANLSISNHYEFDILLFATKLGKFPIVLSLP